MKKNTRYIVICLISMLSSLTLKAQEEQTQVVMPGESPKPTKYIAVEEEKEHLVFFQGFTLSVDVYGPVAYLVSDYGTAEAALRINLKNTYFPIVEVGYGQCDKTDFNTSVSYHVNAPYARLGLDINMLKDKFQDNRLYLGARYGISKYKYDIAGPAMTDPIWGGSQPFDFDGIDCTSHWAELLLGTEVKIYKNFHMGWAVRYKREISSTKSNYAKPSCIPGYGYTTNSTCWGGTFCLIFDLNWGKKKSHKRSVSMEIRDIPQNEEKMEEDESTQEEEQMDILENEDKTDTIDNGEQDDTNIEEGTEEV